MRAVPVRVTTAAASESGSDEHLCFFITRIGEEGPPEREQADGVMDAIVKPPARDLGLECVRADHVPDPGQITTQIIDRIVGAKMVVAGLTGVSPTLDGLKSLALLTEESSARPTITKLGSRGPESD